MDSKSKHNPVCNQRQHQCILQGFLSDISEDIALLIKACGILLKLSRDQKAKDSVLEMYPENLLFH